MCTVFVFYPERNVKFAQKSTMSLVTAILGLEIEFRINYICKMMAEVEGTEKEPETNQWVLKETNEELIDNLRGSFSLNNSVNHNINHC